MKKNEGFGWKSNRKKNICIILAAVAVIVLAFIGILSFAQCSGTKAFVSQETSTDLIKIEAEKSEAGIELESEAESESEAGPKAGLEAVLESEVPAEDSELLLEETGSEIAEADGTAEEQLSWKEDHVKVHGIYVTGPMAGSSGMENLITLLDETELNTMVIDVKDDFGNITYDMNLSSVQELGNCIKYIRNMEDLLATLKEHDIYTIARIVCFKDNCLAMGRPELALKTSDGTYVTDSNGICWVNPYSEEVWAYLTEIAKEALAIGFDEVQFDYVRFPVGNVANAADYGVDMQNYPKEQAIASFLSYVKEQLGDHAVVGADLFGTVIGNEVDMERVGQDYKTLGEIVDVLCPMVYPSHYANGVFGLSVPDAYPYETVLGALNNSVIELSEIENEKCAVVRPWLQSFTATWVDGSISYGGEQIRAQIQAVYDAGYDEWILWNASNRYSTDGLLPQ
ncbi:MAG: putative glycoside hydrolase [Lachnospiraceae bacterium]